MTPDRFTPYSCSFSGNVPEELWMDYDEEEAIDREDDDDNPTSPPNPENTESSTGQDACRCEHGILAGVMAILTRGIRITYTQLNKLPPHRLAISLWPILFLPFHPLA